MALITTEETALSPINQVERRSPTPRKASGILSNNFNQWMKTASSSNRKNVMHVPRMKARPCRRKPGHHTSRSWSNLKLGCKLRESQLQIIYHLNIAKVLTKR